MESNTFDISILDMVMVSGYRKPLLVVTPTSSIVAVSHSL